ncbi:hypothetical protein KUL156_17260 [Alteromonas sp. KUL156]|nr:hypothetical protein KUL154_03500 [Alteromonas sp. KUL154]GFD99133.1 hypothetical protein KUL156_17260 [Alteromonas sp. KUL156]
MSKFIHTFFAIFISLSAIGNSGKINILGQVKNHSFDPITITYLNNQKLTSTEFDVDGKFSISAEIEGGYYFLKYGRNTIYIYLNPKDELSIFFDAKNFKETLVFEGKGATRNKYLAKKAKVKEELTKDFEAFYKVDETVYLKNLMKIKDAHLTLLSQYDVERFFVKEEKKSLEYERLLNIQNYKSNYKFYLGDDIILSENFYEPIKKVNLNNDKDYKKQLYFRYLVNSVWSKRIDAAPNVDEMLNVLRRVPSKELAISLVNGFYSKITIKENRAKDYLNLIKKVTNHKPFIEAVEKKYEKIINSKALTVGDASPEFSFEDIGGKEFSLGDFKGKYVYIDVWATWCTPCIKQIPYLKELEKRYHDKNIVFVSISVDKKEDKDTWRNMINDKGLVGVQLFADKSFESDFMNAYAVTSIPRFILIDPQGKIVTSEAPRPSFDKTKTLLDKLLN